MTELLRVEDLHVHFPVRRGLLAGGAEEEVRAVDGVSLSVSEGEVLALVGESGSGKTTLAKALLHLVRHTSGRVLYRGQEPALGGRAEMRRWRRQVQLVYQDPYESLDSRQTVFEIVEEPLLIHGIGSGPAGRRALVLAALADAGLHPPAEVAQRFPHHLSGGERQRVVIAAAMVAGPELVIADEPVSMLDVSVRAEVLGLMLDLRRSRSLTYLFITHDLSLAWVIADRIAVMYLGRIVEMGSAQELINDPQHPYTRALVSVVPTPEPGRRAKRLVLPGETPSAVKLPSGCRFHPRCWLSEQLGRPQQCSQEDPALRQVGGTRQAACHFVEGVGNGG